MSNRKGVGGRPRKPAAEHKADGTFRKHRHADRLELHTSSGPPPMPATLGDVGREQWRLILRELPDSTLSKLDASLLESYCQLCDLNAVLMPQWKANPIDKDVRIAATAVIDRMEKLARQFGLSPQSRAGIKVAPKQEGEDPFDAFMKKRAEQN